MIPPNDSKLVPPGGPELSTGGVAGPSSQEGAPVQQFIPTTHQAGGPTTIGTSIVKPLRHASPAP